MRNSKIAFVLHALLLALTGCSDILEKDISESAPEILGPKEPRIEYGTISFWWTEIDGATQYRLQLVTTSFAAPQRLVLDTLVAKNIFNYTPDVGVYQWRVQALNNGYNSNFSSLGDLEVIEAFDLSRVTLQLLAPPQNTVTNGNSVLFSWVEIPIATGYRVQIFDAENVIEDDTIQEGLYNIDFPDEDNVYQWQVTAFNDGSKTTSEKRTLTIDKTSPGTPVLLVPKVDSTLEMSAKVRFRWTRASADVAADSFYIIRDDGTTSEKIVRLKTSEPFVDVLMSNQSFNTTDSYVWRVKSIDKGGNVSGHTERSFTVFEP